VQCGMGRTGKLFAFFNDAGVKPDVVTLAKALGGGMPIGAMLIGSRAENTFQFGSHGSTFGGNPLACSVARAVLKKLQTPQLMKNVKDRSVQLASGLAAINNTHGIFREIRGRGLMMGAELQTAWHGKAGEISDIARQYGVLILQAGPSVLRFVPPLTITDKEMREGIKRLTQAIDAYVKKTA
jgi:acetylornithine/N-succinyldiaminopimelate aminotransferase